VETLVAERPPERMSRNGAFRLRVDTTA